MRRLGGLALATVLAGGSAAADVVELTTGDRFVGIVKGTSAMGVVLEFHGRDVTIPHKLVRGISFDAAPSPPALPPPAAPSPPVAPSPAADAPPPAATPSPIAAPPPAPTPAGAPPVVAPRPRVAPAPPPVRLTGPPELRDALTALDSLTEATARGVDRVEYGRRLDVAKSSIERYRETTEGSGPGVRGALRAALAYHAFALAALEAYEKGGDLAAVGRNPLVVDCARLGATIAREAAALRFDARDPAFAGLIVAVEGVDALRECAAEKIAEAERGAGPAP